MPTVYPRWIRKALCGLLAAGLDLSVVFSVVPAPGSPDLRTTLRESWRWVRFGTAEGLPSDWVATLVESPDGTAWAGTRRGVAFYDGYVWNPVRGLPGVQPVSIEVGARGELIVVADGRVYVGGRSGFEPVLLPPANADAKITAAVPAEDGGLFLDVRGGPAPTTGELPEGRSWICLWRDGRLRSIPSPLLVNVDRTRSLMRTRPGRVWLNGAGGLHRYTGAEWRIELKMPPRCAVRQLVEDAAGRGLVSILAPQSVRGLWEWTAPDELHRVEALGEDVLQSMDIAPDGQVIVVSESGQVQVRSQHGWGALSPVPDEMQNALTVQFRANGDLWVGTEHGLYLHRGSSQLWTSWRHSPFDARNRVHDILRAADGSIWVATGGGVEVHRPDGQVESLDRAGPSTLRNVTGLAEDTAGRIWVSSGVSFDGAWRREPSGTWTHFGPRQGLEAARVHRIRKDSQGRLWFLGIHREGEDPSASSGPGAFLLDGERFIRWGSQEGLPSGRVYDLAEGQDGSLWFATAGGLARHGERGWTIWGMGDGMRSDRVYAVVLDRNGQPWFCHQQEGLGTLEDGHLRYYTTADGLVHDDVWGLSFAPDGTLWIATRNGLGCLRRGTFSRFDTRDGLSNRLLWPVLAEADRVFVGTLGSGLAILRPGWLSDSPPRVFLEPPSVEPRRVVLRWRAFAHWAETAPALIETRYRVDAGPWSSWSATGELSLPPGAPGNHAFEVQAKGPLGAFDPAGASLTFRVPLPLTRNPLILGPLSALGLTAAVLGLVLFERRRRHEREIRLSEERYRDLFENANDILFTRDLEGRITSINRSGEQILGCPRGRALGRHLEEFVSPAWREPVGEAFRRAAQDGHPTLVEAEVTAADGRRSLLEIVTRRMLRDGLPSALQSIARDIGRRRELEEQLRHSQKMEAVGRLAGGVAHDFSNLLTAIIGHGDQLVEALDRSHPARREAEQIQKAAASAASLTRQLLAISRRQVLMPEVLDLNAVVSDMEDLLHRILGEDVKLVIRLDPAVRRVRADGGQLQQVILNLVVNAREAMPGGGVLRIETASLAADGEHRGEWIVLSVTDTGRGMDEATRSRLFEPFFTTKPGGTGLGLSTVYGIIRQSDGQIAVDSRPGRGTTFRVHLPLIEGCAEPGPSAPEPAPERGGTETILLVEDQDAVRLLVAEALRTRGYRLLEAADGDRAEALLARHDGPIHLLLTDVVMPRVSGPDLARRVQALRPGIRVLYVSGYTENEMIHRGVAAESVHFLQKPFRTADLAAAVRRTLDG